MLHFLYRDRNWLLQRINQLDVWSKILNSPAKEEEWILNPLRTDKHLGSCKLRNMNGNIVLIDFADKSTNGSDCISAYMKLNPYKSWSEVTEDLLDIGKGLGPSSSGNLARYKYKEEAPKHYTPLFKKWSDEYKEWWNRRGVTIDQLKRKETPVNPVKGYIREQGNNKFEKHFSELCFSYSFHNRHKFYFPERKNYRFMGTLKPNDLWFLNRGSDTLLVKKSHKDMLVVENLCDFNLTHLQNERVLPSKDIFFEWESNHKKIIIFMDNDKTGIEMANEIQKNILYTPTQLIFIEPEYAKDIDEYRVKNGFRESYDYFNYLINV